MEWEITPEDVQIVFGGHKAKCPDERADEIHGELDHDDIIDTLMYYDTFETQTASMLSEIEDHCIEKGYLKGPKRYHVQDDKAA